MDGADKGLPPSPQPSPAHGGRGEHDAPFDGGCGGFMIRICLVFRPEICENLIVTALVVTVCRRASDTISNAQTELLCLQCGRGVRSGTRLCLARRRRSSGRPALFYGGRDMPNIGARRYHREISEFLIRQNHQEIVNYIKGATFSRNATGKQRRLFTGAISILGLKDVFLSETRRGLPDNTENIESEFTRLLNSFNHPSRLGDPRQFSECKQHVEDYCRKTKFQKDDGPSVIGPLKRGIPYKVTIIF